MLNWLKKYKFWLVWTPISIFWLFLSFCIVNIYGDSTRGLAFLLASPLVIVGLYFTSKRTKALESRNRIDDNRLLVETFAKSIELLGHKKSAVRQGAIYALGKIVETNIEERAVIANTLCAFVRDSKFTKKFMDKQNYSLAIDIEAGIKVIVRISKDLPKGGGDKRFYDLSNIYLKYADFSDADFENFNLSDSIFESCLFDKANFSNSNLINTVFGNSNFKDAEFSQDTELGKTNLSQVENLTEEQKETIMSIKEEYREGLQLP